MKFTFALATLTALAAAQSLTDLPSCSLSCLLEGVAGVNCQTTDFSCSCPKASSLISSLTTCVDAACKDQADRTKVVTVLQGICASAGFPISGLPGSSTAPASSSAPAATSKASSATSEALSSYDLTPSQTPTPTPTRASTASSVSVVKPSGSGVSSSNLPVFTGAAAAVKVPAAVAGAFGLAAFVL